MTAFLTRAEAAALLRRSAKSLDRLIAADPTFPRTKLTTGAVLIPVAPLEVWLRGRTEGTRGPLRLVDSARTSAAPQRTDVPGALKTAENAS